MGNENTKLNYRKAVIQLTTKTQSVDASDDPFWNQFWSEYETTVQDIFILIPAAEIRALREESPNNLATLCYKAVEKLIHIGENPYPTHKEQQTALNCIRLLTRILPYIFEEPDWRSFFWSSVPAQPDSSGEPLENPPVAKTLISALSDLLFFPDFTVNSAKKNAGPENPEEAQCIDSCEYIWEAGVGFANSPAHNPAFDSNRAEILKLLLTCFSETIYLPANEAHSSPNQWISYFTSTENRHALPLFTSMLNVVCAYDPVGYGLPYNHLMFNDSREPLIEVALQVLCVTLEAESSCLSGSLSGSRASIDGEDANSDAGPDNLFVNYMSRIHRDEDFAFILKGISRLLNNPLIQTYLPGSTKKVQFHQELLILLWRMCDINKKFMFYVLKSSHVLEILVPILFHLNDARADQSRVGLMHIGVFILLLLSGERNFGVRLNKPYQVRVPMDIPVFTGTHADLLIIVFHKIITTGHQRLQPLFDCLLTIIVNISPYLKTLSMVSATKLLHLLEAFSTPWFLYASYTNHHLVFFLLEVFNNIIQYQFDGNSNLVYTIIRKRQVFHQLANLPTDHQNIAQTLSKKGRRIPTASVSGPSGSTGGAGGAGRDTPGPSSPRTEAQPSMLGSQPAAEAEPGTLKASLEATPAIEHITDCQPASKANPEGQGDDEVEITCPTPPPLEDQPAQPQQSYQGGEGGTGGSALEEFQQQTPSRQVVDTSKTSSHRHVHDEELLGEESGTGSPVQYPPPTTLAGPAIDTPARPSTSDSVTSAGGGLSGSGGRWVPTPEWVLSWKQKLPLQTIMRLLQVLVPQVEKICIDKGLTDESEILKFLQHGTLVGLLPVPHPILIRKYQSNAGTSMWFRTYMWGVIYLRNVDPPIWYDTDVRLFEIQRV